MNKLVIGIVLANLLAACASEKPKVPVPEPVPVVERAPAPAPVNKIEKIEEPPIIEKKVVAAPVPAPKVEIDPLTDPKSILAKRSVYYPFDVDAVQDADKPIVEAHAKYLKDHPNRKVRLEGNCDERGSNEYNLGLGQRRADGVKKMLELGGARESQLTSYSYGEEVPRATGHDEASWAQNRRTDIKYVK